MKCVGAQYLEAIRKLKEKGFVPLRTLHVSFVPGELAEVSQEGTLSAGYIQFFRSDEEVGGEKGMGYFVTTPEFKNLNVGFGLDEGIASPDESYNLYYGERTLWRKKSFKFMKQEA